jgi:hypothetical protein
VVELEAAARQLFPPLLRSSDITEAGKHAQSVN